MLIEKKENKKRQGYHVQRTFVDFLLFFFLEKNEKLEEIGDPYHQAFLLLDFYRKIYFVLFSTHFGDC